MNLICIQEKINKLIQKKIMKLSKILHVVSVVMGLIGITMSAWVVLFWPVDAVWFRVTRNVMMFCSITSILAAIWLQIGTIHHMMLEKQGEVI